MALLATTGAVAGGFPAAVAAFMEARNNLALDQGMAAVAAMPSTLPDPPHMPAGRRAYDSRSQPVSLQYGIVWACTRLSK